MKARTEGNISRVKIKHRTENGEGMMDIKDVILEIGA
jgi:hypothetical protein